MSDNKPILNPSDCFFYSRKAELEKVYNRALEVDRDATEFIVADNNLSLIEKLSELDIIVNGQ